LPLGALPYCIFADLAVGLASIIAGNGRFRRERVREGGCSMKRALDRVRRKRVSGILWGVE
jgi:hypothetical protein